MQFLSKFLTYSFGDESARKQWLEYRRIERYKRRIALQKKLFLVPHIFTLTNVFCGFYALILVGQGDLEKAALMILFGALFDGFDGRIARYVGSEGPFGLQLDSLGDAISFCVAPIFLSYYWQLHYLGFFGVLISTGFLCAGLIRLARFNILAEKTIPYFLGVPTTVAGSFLVIIFLNRVYFERLPHFLFVFSLLVLILAGLMVSSIKFPAFKKMPTKKRVYYWCIGFGFAYALLGLGVAWLLLGLFILYFCTALVL